MEDVNIITTTRHFIRFISLNNEEKMEFFAVLLLN